MNSEKSTVAEKPAPFSYVIENNENGKGVIKITLFGEKQEWEEKLCRLIKEKYENVYEQVLEKIIAEVGESLNKITTIEILCNKVQEVNDVIASIAEVPLVVKGTSLPVIHLSKEINGIKRNVVMLGETHIATKKEAIAVSRIMPFFKNFGCEGVDTKGFVEGRIFFWLMEHVFNYFASFISFGRRSKKNKNSLDLANDYAGDFTSQKRVILKLVGFFGLYSPGYTRCIPINRAGTLFGKDKRPAAAEKYQR